ncbi:MAG: hypothetical protein Q8K32_00600 [Archangium sp.]|nr:hypothetical protein [Archangium sp.]
MPEKRCGESAETYFSASAVEDLEALADCTILVGRFQQDSVAQLQDFAPLQNVWKIEGALNVFRSPGIVSLHGFENLQIVEGSLFIHQNENLETIGALGKLRTVTQRLYIGGNRLLPQAQVDAFASRVTVCGSKDVAGNE